MQVRSLRPFIGAKDFPLSRQFYRDLGFEENEIGAGFSVFHKGGTVFYLQDYYVKDWVDNTMLFLEVEDLDGAFAELQALQLSARYEGVRLLPIKEEAWGRECFLMDPSGILWHIGQFKSD